MSRFTGLSGMEPFKSLPGSNSGAAAPDRKRKRHSSSSIEPSHSFAYGSFAYNRKLIEEMLVKERASAKIDLDLANSKHKKLTEQLSIFEEILQNDKVKQKDGEKFSSTKYDQFTETLQQLNNQIQLAVKDKMFLENMKSMFLRLGASEETIKTCDNELLKLGNAKNDMETAFKNELNRAARLLEEKDGTVKQLEKDVATNKMALERLTSKIKDLQLEIGVKEEDMLALSISKEKLEGEKKHLLSSKNGFADRLEIALSEIMNLQDFVTILIVKFMEFEEQSLTFFERHKKLNDLFESCLELARKEKDVVSEYAQTKLDQIRNQCASVISEKNASQMVNQELNSQVLQLQNEREYAMVQHAEACRLAEEKTRKLESEAECLVSKQTEMQFLIVKLKDSLNISSENSIKSDKKMQDLLLKYAELENNSKALVDGLKEEILKKQNDADLLQKEFEKSEGKIVSLEKRVSELEIAIEEKEQFVVELKTKEKQLDDQKAEITVSLADTESKLEEAKKEYDHMLENKHLELSKHLKEISQRNDQAINDIRRKYEVEKQEIVNLEKEKADKVIQDMELKIAELKEENQQHLLRVQEEHAVLVSNMQQEHDNKEMILISKHTEELKLTQLQKGPQADSS